MSDRMMPAVLAGVGGFFLAVLLAVPYLAWSYRRRGEFGAGHAFLAVGFLVYALSLATYTLLPLPQLTEDFCAKFGMTQPQLHPFQFVTDMAKYHRGTGIRGLLRNPALQSVLFNVALFVPLGMFFRHLFRRGVITTVLAGFGVSLFIELTQLTGNWFLFPCPYRLFDVDDLMANTTGAALGIVLAPLLRLVPWQKTTLPPDAPRPVTAWRRITGVLLDLLSVWLLGSILQVLVNIAIQVSTGVVPLDQPWGLPLHVALAYWVPAVLLLLVVPLAGNGGTVGQRIVLLRPVDQHSGARPAAFRMLVRFLFGSGGYYLLIGWAALEDTGSLLATLLLVVSLVMVFTTRGRRGLSGVVAGLDVADARQPGPATRLDRERSVPSDDLAVEDHR